MFVINGLKKFTSKMNLKITKSSVCLDSVFQKSLIPGNYEEYGFHIKDDNNTIPMCVFRESIARHYANPNLPGYCYGILINADFKLNLGFFKSRTIFRKVRGIFNSSQEELKSEKIEFYLNKFW
jgi:hypothetical protein